MENNDELFHFRYTVSMKQRPPPPPENKHGSCGLCASRLAQSPRDVRFLWHVPARPRSPSSLGTRSTLVLPLVFDFWIYVSLLLSIIEVWTFNHIKYLRSKGCSVSSFEIRVRNGACVLVVNSP